MLINADLKQIEVVMFAQLCKPKKLVELLNAGKDIHKFIGSSILGISEDEVTDLQRTDAKTSTFGIIYGNGAKTLSERTGRSQDWCAMFIRGFFEMFPEAKEWHNKIIEAVNQTGKLKLFTNETLKFTKFPAKYQWQFDQGIVESYNPPDIKNHPVQHLAWIVMSILLGEFYRIAVHKKDKYLIINTVHDSLMADCKDEYVDECVQDIAVCIDKLPEVCYNLWSERLIVPIKIDISVGHRWSEL